MGFRATPSAGSTNPMRKKICCGKRTKRGRKAMADPFELWRKVWSSAVTQEVERFVVSFVPSTALVPPRPAEPFHCLHEIGAR
jgi:hypothetical protein